MVEGQGVNHVVEVFGTGDVVGSGGLEMGSSRACFSPLWSSCPALLKDFGDFARPALFDNYSGGKVRVSESPSPPLLQAVVLIPLHLMMM